MSVEGKRLASCLGRCQHSARGRCPCGCWWCHCQQDLPSNWNLSFVWLKWFNCSLLQRDHHEDWMTFFFLERCFLASLCSPNYLDFKEGRELVAREGREGRVWIANIEDGRSGDFCAFFLHRRSPPPTGGEKF